MADQDNYKTYVRETRTTESSGSSMALIVGGLVVAVAFILWLVFGGENPSVVSTTPDADTTNVTVEPTAPADSTTNVTIDADEPAPVEPVEIAPAEPAPAEPAEPATNP
jgi:hypothetical protein